MDDTEFRWIAIEESGKGDWPYGAVIVKDGVIVFKGSTFLGGLLGPVQFFTC